MHLRHKTALLLTLAFASIVTLQYLFVSSALGPAARLLDNSILLLAAAPLLLACVLGAVYANQLSTSISGFTGTIENISRGKLDSHVHGKERHDELGDLARAFDRVLVSLKIAVEKVGLKKEELKLGLALEAKERAERELQKERTFTQSIIKNAGVPVISYARDGTLLLTNNTFLSLTSYTKADLLHQDHWLTTAFSADAQPKIKTAIKNALNGKTITDLVIPITCKNGTSTIIANNITPLLDEKGNIIGTTHFMRDLSEIFTLEQQVFSWVNTPAEEAPKNIQISPQPINSARRITSSKR